MPPQSEDELTARAEAIAGRTFGEVAARAGVSVPPDLTRHKGWVGNLMERVLGADAASRDEPDFRQIGVELKTLPVDAGGKPLESTFVATIPLGEVGEVAWEQSRVWRKLARVLWLPVEGTRSVPLATRRVGAAILWSPSVEQQRALRYDWEELAGIIGRGDIDAVTGKLGRYLQVRPKAAHGGVRTQAIDAEGEMHMTLPRGFYLRTQFTQQIMRAHFGRS